MFKTIKGGYNGATLGHFLMQKYEQKNKFKTK